jgi:hypothetical protein
MYKNGIIPESRSVVSNVFMFVYNKYPYHIGCMSAKRLLTQSSNQNFNVLTNIVADQQRICNWRVAQEFH